MKVSVIIPCYNFEDYIEQSILSAVSQKTNFEFEILVRDDLSTDSSQVCIERVSNFNNNVKYFKSEENWGGQKNVKFLIEQAKGEYIAYLDGDDYWTDVYKLQKQVDFMDSNSDYILNFTGHWTKKENEYSPSLPYQWLCLPGYFESDEIKIEDLVKGNWSSSFGRLFRNTPGLFKDWMMDVVYFDWIINYELSKLGKIKYLDFPSGVYRIHINGALSGMEHEKSVSHARDILRLILNDYEKFIKKND